MNRLSGITLRLLVLLMVFLLFSGNELYAKKISRSSSPGSSSYTSDDDTEEGYDDETEDEPVYREQKAGGKTSVFSKFKRKFKGKKRSEDVEEYDELEMAEEEWEDGVREASREGSVYVPKSWPPYEGPKISIAVLDFENGISQTPITQGLMDKDAFLHVFYGFGEGLASMLMSTLQSTNRFNILEKKISKRVFEIYSTNVAKSICQSGKPKIEQTPGVKYFVLGSVTDITVDTGGSEGQVQTKWFLAGKVMSVSSITVHMRIIDASTGLVVYSKRLEGTLVGESFNLGASYAGFGVGGSKSEKTQLGNAAQKLLDKSAEDIIATTS